MAKSENANQTSPSPPQEPPGFFDVTAKPVNTWDILVELGFWQKVDWFMVMIQLLIWLFMGAWEFFENPVLMNYVCALLVSGLIQTVWLTIVAFRCCHFVLMTRSDINTIHFDAARIAVGYLQGKTPR